MNWLLFEDKIIALDMFNTMLDPIMVFIVVMAIILTLIEIVRYMTYEGTGCRIYSIKTSNIIKVVLLLILTLVIVVGITNIIEHYLHELMKFDGYMYINYAKKIIEI